MCKFQANELPQSLTTENLVIALILFRHKVVRKKQKFLLLENACNEWLSLSSANLTLQAFTINKELGMLVRGGRYPAGSESNSTY